MKGSAVVKVQRGSRSKRANPTVRVAAAAAVLSTVVGGIAVSVPARAATTPGSTLTACHSLSNPAGTYTTEALVASDTQGDRYDLSIGAGVLYLDQNVSFSTPGAPGSTGGTNWYAGGKTHVTGTTKLFLGCKGDLGLWGPGGVRLWHSNTAGKGGNRVTLTSGGALVIYTAKNKVVWSTRSGRDTLPSGRSLWAGQTLVGALRPGMPRNTLTMERDGNLVYRSNGTIRWQTHTSTPRSHTRLTAQGLLQVVTPTGRVVWTTSRHGWGGFLSMYDGELYNGDSSGYLWQVPHFLG